MQDAESRARDESIGPRYACSPNRSSTAPPSAWHPPAPWHPAARLDLVRNALDEPSGALASSCELRRRRRGRSRRRGAGGARLLWRRHHTPLRLHLECLHISSQSPHTRSNLFREKEPYGRPVAQQGMRAGAAARSDAVSSSEAASFGTAAPQQLHLRRRGHDQSVATRTNIEPRLATTGTGDDCCSSGSGSGSAGRLGKLSAAVHGRLLAEDGSEMAGIDGRLTSGRVILEMSSAGIDLTAGWVAAVSSCVGVAILRPGKDHRLFVSTSFGCPDWAPPPLGGEHLLHLGATRRLGRLGRARPAKRRGCRGRGGPKHTRCRGGPKHTGALNGPGNGANVSGSIAATIVWGLFSQASLPPNPQTQIRLTHIQDSK